MTPRDVASGVLAGMLHCLIGSGVAGLASALVLVLVVRLLT